ncbi:GGDEF domain-containing protein [Curvibacter gracilis]|uniref:GGDEF domain-containing protein n=1 Tax=Curvibacter gracilis TaxID=230310 RepID=UPI0004B1C0AC|nr:GGDEF domain-containing protein [Curvibacter gracilis]
MTLHLPTLLVALTLASGVLASAVLAVAWGGRRYKGLSLWGLGLVLNALSYPAFGLRDAGWLSLSILLTNALTALSLVIHTLALMAFQRGRSRSPPSWVVWVPAALNMLAAVALLHDDRWRNVLVAGLQALMALVLLSQAWAPGLHGRRLTGRWVVIAGASTLCVTMVLRTLFMLEASEWDAQFNVPTQVQVATYFAILGVLLLNSMGYVLMQMEHAVSQQHELASHDRLTGLYNRLALMELMDHHLALARRRGSPLALLMLDIDHFKVVNDQHGHLVGDEVLRQVAQRAQARLRGADLLARFGGEEFLALLPATTVEGAQAVAEGIRRAVGDQPMVVNGVSIPVTISIGVHAAIPTEGPTAAEAMIALSDQALYDAKHQGRNRVVVR